ncbi:SprT-like family protein [Tundrisphaera lichenicola]|uniref:SprT-like family protein n=1 Tax=Tundrisphaera lichenicola TaxID=2029860 RepID=UPI003EB76488
MLDRSPTIRTGNFESIAVGDLRLLFGLYDAEFFGGLLTAMLGEQSAGEVQLRLSDRMTRAAGKTFWRRVRTKVGWRVEERSEYEIAVSTFLLFQNFRVSGRVVTVAGLVCSDRLVSLQRIFEHELLHLAEFLAIGRSSCSAELFRSLSRSIFGHSASVHELVTPREVAASAHSIRIGDRVAFDHEGVTQVGRVNRITKRATVLVEDPAGRPFSDGKRYSTYYVPLDRLRKAT